MTVVGVGMVGMACAYTMLSQELVGHLVLSDVAREKLQGEVMDLQHAGAFLHGQVEMASEDYHETAGSHVIVVTAGVRQREGETRRDLLARNVAVFKSIIPPLAKLSPNAIFLVVSNPVDVMTYVTWRLSGLPTTQIIGSGTYLDSSRFRVMLASRLNVSAQSVHATIIGEHGDSSVPVWSGVNVAGIPYDKVIKAHGVSDESWKNVHTEVKNSAYTIIKAKGYTNWAIGAAVGRIVQTILHNDRRVIPVSININGCFGVTRDCYISVPTIVGRTGSMKTVLPDLAPEEMAAFQKSVSDILAMQDSIADLL